MAQITLVHNDTYWFTFNRTLWFPVMNEWYMNSPNHFWTCLSLLDADMKWSSSSIVWQTVQVRRWVAIFGLAWRPHSIPNTCEIVPSLAIDLRYQSSSSLCIYFSDSKLCSNIWCVLNIGLSSDLSSFFQSFIKRSITLDLHWDLNEVKFPCRAIP